ncbi:MAG: LPS export ABC transporter periplasmic protein LptC [Alphaproteobacteria bacterium]
MSLKDKFSIESSYESLSRTRFLKRAFSIGIVAIIVGVFLWSYIGDMIHTWNFSGTKIKVDGIDFQKKEIKNPRFLGGKEQPYTITAKLARQIADNKVYLEEVNGRLLSKDGSVLFVLSDEGEITTDQSKLVWLKGSVNFICDKNNLEIWTNSAFSDLNKGYMEGKEFVEGESDQGFFESQGFFINQKDRTLKLLGPVKLTIRKSGGKK